jgi:hypothetical protein
MVVIAAFDDAIVHAGTAEYDKVFALYLRSCAQKYWKGHRGYYSPYVVLFQSSMTGKSRLLKEMAQKTFFTVIICVRKQSVVMQPPRTKAVADALFQGKVTSSRGLMLVLLKSYLQQFQQWVDKSVEMGSQITPKDWHDQQEAADSKVGRALDEALKTSDFDMELPDWKVVLRNLGQHAARSSLDMLFVFDEARELLNKDDDDGINLFRYLFVCNYVHMYACICMYVCMHACMHTYMYIFVPVYVYVCMSCMHVSMYPCIHVYNI